MLKKYLKISLILILLFTLYEKIDYQTHSYLINNMRSNNSYKKQDYIGYIKIDRLNIKREIKKGINDINLINHVVMNDNCDSFKCSNIILAGHAIKNIFGNLKNIKVNDLIELNDGDKYFFKVDSIDIVDKSNTSIIDNSNLILITCYDLNKRIIVKAKRI